MEWRKGQTQYCREGNKRDSMKYLLITAPLASMLVFAQAALAQPTVPPPPPPPILRPPAPDAPSIELIDRQLAAALRYPAAARQTGEEGQPIVSFYIDRGGRVLSADLTRDSGSAALDAEAVDVFKRIGAFHVTVPASYAPGQERFLILTGIGFYLFHKRERAPGIPADAPEGSVRTITEGISDEWRSALIAAVTAAWQQPQSMPEHYKAKLRIKILKDGHQGEVTLIQRSGNDDLDASLLDAARRASIPNGRTPALPTPEIQLCVAAPDSDCSSRESLRVVGTTIAVSSYVPDDMQIVRRTGRLPLYIQQVQQFIASVVRYPSEAQKLNEEGTLYVRVHMLRDGKVTGVDLVQKSPFPPLNNEALALFDRIDQLPPIPEDVLPAAKDFVFDVPLVFALH